MGKNVHVLIKRTRKVLHGAVNKTKITNVHVLICIQSSIQTYQELPISIYMYMFI